MHKYPDYRVIEELIGFMNKYCVSLPEAKFALQSLGWHATESVYQHVLSLQKRAENLIKMSSQDEQRFDLVYELMTLSTSTLSALERAK